MKKGHFRLTCVAQKRCCLSSLLQLLNFLMDFILNCINPYLSKAWHKCSPFKGIPTGNNTCTRASDISRKAKFRRIFRGKFVEKSADFAGKKSKFADKSADFAGFLRKKSQNSQKIGWFQGKKFKFRRIFRGKLLGKSADFTGNFRAKLRQEAISKKTADFAAFFWANFAKINQFCVDMTSVV